MEENKKEANAKDGDLGDYITQVVTDFGKSFNKELLMNKLAQTVPKVALDGTVKKMRCKMASATNAIGITADEYGKFAIHVYQYLSYIKTLEIPHFSELEDLDKPVTIKNADLQSKYHIHIFTVKIKDFKRYFGLLAVFYVRNLQIQVA
jgi:hypothetical protein